jgi:uncharacterized membrane protein
MNNAHIHLIVNHLPIVGLLIGTLILIAGLILRKPDVKFTALWVYVFSAITAFLAFQSGERAEEVIEHLPGISESLIHTHEEYAETFLLLSIGLGVLSILTIVALWRKVKYSSLLIFLCLAVALATGVSAKYTGTSGGEIRHDEIRAVYHKPAVKIGDSDDR